MYSSSDLRTIVSCIYIHTHIYIFYKSFKTLYSSSFKCTNNIINYIYIIVIIIQVIIICRHNNTNCTDKPPISLDIAYLVYS